MLGAVVGDIVGSTHEYAGTKTKSFPLFAPNATYTDDSVLTVAVADWLLHGRDLVDYLHDYVQAFPGRGYGGMFGEWSRSRRREPYGSFGNGSAMRVSPVGFAFDTIDEIMDWAARSSAVTHDHPEAIRAAQATAVAVLLARQGATRNDIRDETRRRFGYPLTRTIADIRAAYSFTETAYGTVPPAITAFLESTDYEDAIRTAISLGGDADTMACITGGIADAFYGGVPEHIAEVARAIIDPRLLSVIDEFTARHPQSGGG